MKIWLYPIQNDHYEKESAHKEGTDEVQMHHKLPVYHCCEYTSIECFTLRSHLHIFVSYDVVQLAECTPTLSNFPFHFLYLVIVLSQHFPEINISLDLFDLLFINNYINLVDMLVTHYFSLPQMHLKAYWVADVIIADNFL